MMSKLAEVLALVAVAAFVMLTLKFFLLPSIAAALVPGA